jgi:beta-galactosidase
VTDPGLWYGGDYNPEQWGPDTWAEDDELMRRAGVNTATVGVFAWSSLEPEEGKYSFDWLDRTLDRLHGNGIRAVLATPTASPPPWFSFAHPDALPVTADGTRLWHGSRDTYCAAAPAYRRAALRIAEALADRYAGHPALAMWHVHNEYGTLCHCDHAATAFRRWLRERYDGDLAALNTAWNTAFWSQGYADWDQIVPPRATQYLPNPGQTLDFSRFWSDELLAAYREQRDALRLASPGIPVTTNFMLPNDYQNLDLWRWGREVDVVAVDHYLNSPGPAGREDLAFGADQARSFNRGKPWLLMEQGTSVIYLYDQGIIAAKEPGQLRSDSLGYLARGSDSMMFFQWRAGRGGAELHHSAMVPHAGPDTRVFREIVELGSDVGRLAELAGSRVRAPVAVLWDVESWWAMESRGQPSTRMRYLPALREVHAALWRAGVVTDLAHPEDNLSRYDAVFAPSLYLLSDSGAASLEEYVRAGGRLVVGCFSGVADQRHAIRLGGYPGGLMEVLGLRVEEFHPLTDDRIVTLSTGATGTRWSEDLQARDAEVLATYVGGPLDGKPAITQNRYGAGTGWYVSTCLDAAALAALVDQVLAVAGVEPALPGAGANLEAVRRFGDDGRSWLFVFNHGDADCQVPARGLDLLTGAQADGVLRLAPGAAAVVREQ